MGVQGVPGRSGVNGAPGQLPGGMGRVRKGGLERGDRWGRGRLEAGEGGRKEAGGFEAGREEVRRVSGPRGPNGRSGLRGPVGPRGAIGAIGLRGERGARGLPGPAGMKGTDVVGPR